MLSGFKPLDSMSYVNSLADGAQSGLYTASVVGETKQVNHAGQFQGMYYEHDLQGCFGFVLVFLPVKVWAPNKI